MKQTKCWILTLVIFYLLGLLLFLRGYFIDRQYLLDRSDGPNFKTQPVILLIIDSFRIDLALSQHFKFFTEMKQNNPDQTLLFLSFAEVPTVTGPRLQAMTSGNFPPLSKLLDNFHASEIVEDNIMFQMKRFNKKTLFSGDDTWIGLYPNIFTEQYPLKSFNIGDMQTVDSFNSEKIFTNIDKGFDLIVSHFLGLDHAGHKNNKVLNNPSLDDKLSQLNYIINSTYNLMSNDTILIVAGDHGMANDGNHGGNSTEETNTVFFAIRKEGKFYPDYMKQITELQDNYISTLASKDSYIRKISQIDVVPTLAKLLGVPIPFSNLGYIINEFFNNEEYCLDNLNQMLRFVQTAHKRQGKFSYSQMNKWENQYQNVKSCKDALILMNDIQFTARRIWNEYNFPLLNLALLLQFLIIIFFILVIFGLYYSQNNDDQITNQQVTATLKYLITKKKLFTFAIFSILLMILIQYEIEILITIILILIILYINLILIVKIKRDYVTDRNQYQWDLIEKPDSVKLNNRFQNLLSLSILLFYIYKIIKQGDLLLSIENKKKEEAYLFNEINQLVIISTIILSFYLLSRIIDTQESNSNTKKIFDCILSFICAIIIYNALNNEQFYLQNNQLQQYLLTPLFQYYLPCLFLHIVLFIYQKEDKLINKIIAQLSLFLIDIFFIYPDQQHLTETAEFIVLHIPKIIYLISFYTIITKDPIYLFFSCLVVSDKFGIAIYSYEILIFILLYFHWKQIIQFCPIAFFGMISLTCQITWFIFGNRCTISSIKLDRAFVGVKEFHLWLNPLILTIFLVGPYLSGIVFLKSIESKINKLLELNQTQIKNSRNLYKLMFLFNFYIQIQYTQIHSYQNAGGLIDVQFKYIFDCVTYLIISLLMLVY